MKIQIASDLHLRANLGARVEIHRNPVSCEVRAGERDGGRNLPLLVAFEPVSEPDLREIEP